MADEATLPTEDPFAQLSPDAAAPAPAAPATPAPPTAQAAAPPPPAGNDNQEGVNPFAELGEVANTDASTTGALARGAEKGTVPALTGMALMGTGAELGAAGGALAGPWGAAGGAIAGALVGGVAGGYLGSTIQNWALSKMPDSWVDALGMSDRQQRLDEAQHPTASFIGGLIPYAITMRPGIQSLAALPENATTMQRIMANKATAAVFGGVVNGGMEAGSELAHGGADALDWQKIGISTGFGVVFNKPTKIGEALVEAGARPARMITGQRHMAMTPPPTVAEAGDLKVMGPGITESVFHGGQEAAPSAVMTAQEAARAERAALGEAPEPDLHGVARQMEPELFAAYDELQRQREAFAAWHGEGGEAAVAEQHLAATDAKIREMGPEIAAAFRRAEETLGPVVEAEPQFKSFAEMLAARERETGEPPPSPAVAKAREDFAKTPVFDTNARDRARAIEQNLGKGAADEYEAEYQRLTERAVAERLAGGEPGVPVGGEAPPIVEGQPGAVPAGPARPQRSIGEQRAAIAADVTEKLIAAGRPEDEARAAGQLVAARYVTRAGRFEGKLGTAEELYAREGAAIAGPEGRARPPRQVVQEAEAQAARQAPAAQEAQAAAVQKAAEPHKPGLISSDFDTSDRIKNEWRKTSPFKEAEPFIEASWHNQRAMAQAADQIAAAVGVEFKNPGIKARPAAEIAAIKDEGKRKLAEASRRRLEAKAKKHGIGGVTDQVRGGFDVQTPAQADQVVAELAKHFPVVDEGWRETPSGYFDRKAYVKFPDGMIGEIQIWPPGMFPVKDRAHGLYEGIRELPPWHPMVPQIEKSSREVYEPVRAALSGEWKAVLGSGGSAPNLLPNSAAERIGASSPSTALTSDHLPPESTQASEGVQKQGSPSSESSFTSDMFGVPAENVGPHSAPVNSVIDMAEKISNLSPTQQKRDVPQYTGNEAPRGVDQPAGVFMFDPTALNVDAKRFQFKGGGDEYGVTGALRSVTKWDPLKAQSIIVWEQSDGKLFVADGHQRAGLARRLTEKGAQKIELPGLLLREKDGVTAEKAKALAAATNIANGSGSALDGAKILRSHPELMDGSIPLSAGKGKQAVALARLGDEPFKMVVNEVVPENYGAVVGDLIPNDPARQEAAMKAIARFEPKNVDEAAVLTQRVAQAELAKAEEGAQGSMFGDLETAESTAGEEMKIVGRAIADLKKDKTLFSRVLRNANRIEETGSNIERASAKAAATDAEIFAKVLSSDAYTAGPVRNELVAAAKELKNGNATIGEATERIIAALRRESETVLANGAGVERGAEPVREFAQKDQFDFEAGAEGKPQALVPGVAPVTQRDLIQAAANKPLKPRVAQKDVGGLFGDSMDQKELFQRDQVETPEFKQWFGDSKIVDEDGAPRVVYKAMEGAVPNIQQDTGMTHVALRRDVAEQFAGKRRPVQEVFVKASKPFDYRNKDDLAWLSKEMSKPENVAEYNRQTKEMMGPTYEHEVDARELVGAIEDGAYQALEVPVVSEAIRAKGYDAIYMREEQAGGEPNLAVFSPEQIKSATENSGAFDSSQGSIFEQTARGTITLKPNSRAVIRLLKESNASTFVHESGHLYLEELMRDAAHQHAPDVIKQDVQTVRDWLGVKGDDEIKTKHHEKFARGFEQYIREGVAPSKELGSVFAKFRDWLLSIYQSLRGLGQEISPEIRHVFDRLLEMEPQRTVVASERTQPSLLHDIHEAEARTMPPHEAEPAMDRIVAESTRYAAEQPPEIARELAAAEEAIRAEDAAASGAAAGEGGAGPGAANPLEPGGGAAGAEPAGGAGGAEHGAVKPGGAAAGAEGAKPDRRAFLGDHPNTALAPGPADLFGARESPFTDRAGNIRLDTLNTSENVKQAIRDSAAENNEFIGDRRGVVTDGQVLELANDLGMDGAEALVKRHVEGQAYNAEQVVALRKLLRESAAEVAGAAKKFAASADDADLVAYAQAKERLQMVHKTVAGATAEAGRALRAFRKLPPGEGVDTAALEQMMREATGKTLFQLKDEAVLVSSLDAPHKINKFMQQRSAGAMVQEAWILGLLSGIPTQVTNAISNHLMAFMHFGPERALSAVIGRIAHGLGREGTFTRLGEVRAAARGAKEGFAPSIHATGEALKRGASGLLPGEEIPGTSIFEGMVHDDLIARATLDQTKNLRDVGAAAFSLIKSIPDSIVATAALAVRGAEGAPLLNLRHSPQGAIPDVQVRGLTIPVGSAIRVPGRLLAAADTFTSSLNFTSELNAIAYRMASDEGLTGTPFWSRIAEIVNNPSPAVLTEARGTARELTFMDRSGELARRLQFLASWEPNLPGVGAVKPIKFLMPFINVVSKILDQTLVKRTPLGLLSKELQADIFGKNGNIAQERAAARMILGTGMLLAFGSMAAGGYITGSGPKDPKENAIWRIDHQPHSIKINGVWYQVSKLGPVGMLMGLAADLHDIRHLVDEDKWAEAGAKLWHAIVQNTLDQSALQGVADATKATEDPERYGPQYIKNFASSFIPFSGFVGNIAKMQDPYVRETWGVIDALKARIPGYSTTLHPKIDFYGQPVPTKDAVGGTGVTGIYMQKLLNDPVSKAMLELNIHPGAVEKKIRGFELTPEQYETYARLAGRMTKERLDVIVNSPDFARWPPEARRATVTGVIEGCRETARGVVMTKWPNIPAEAAALQRKKARGEKVK